MYLCDLSDALLDMARTRVQELGLASQVVLVEGDINAPEAGGRWERAFHRRRSSSSVHLYHPAGKLMLDIGSRAR